MDVKAARKELYKLDELHQDHGERHACHIRPNGILSIARSALEEVERLRGRAGRMYNTNIQLAKDHKDGGASQYAEACAWFAREIRALLDDDYEEGPDGR